MKTIKLLAALFAANILICACNNDSSANSGNDEMSRMAEQLKKDYFGLTCSDLEQRYYKGKVKSVKETKYNAYSKFGDVEIDTLISQEQIEYDKDGYIIYKHNYDKEHFGKTYSSNYRYAYEKMDDKFIICCFKGDTLYKKTIKTFNNRFPIQEDIYNSNGELNERTKYKYDGNGRLSEKVTYNSDGKTRTRLNNIKYDANGFPNRYTIYDFSYNDNKKEEKVTIHDLKNDEYGRILNETVTTDGKIEYLVTLKYKGDKRLSYTHTGFMNGEEDFKIEVQYHDNYNEWILDMKDGATNKENRSEWEYDSNGNITKVTEFVNGEPTNVIITEFEYYE